MLRRLALTLAAIAMVGASNISDASAKDGRNAAFAFGALGGLALGALASSPGSAYAEPAPLVVQQGPVYVPPPPVYYAPPPVYYAPPPPVYYAPPPPVYYASPPRAYYVPARPEDDDD